MDLKRFKLGVGPMSKEIVELCLTYSHMHDYPIMIIASRNQADYDSGYAMNTKKLAELVFNHEHYDQNRILLCRDHCGPYFSDIDKNLELEVALDRCIKTIEMDIQTNFDLIHIDVSRIESSKQQQAAEYMFSRAMELNPNIMFEFGTEDNTGNTVETLNMLSVQLEYVKPWKNNLHYIVSQTGSLTKQTQVGTFNVEQTKKLIDVVHQNGYMFKEHNADYLTLDQVKLRKLTGVDALNIAPQLGTIASSVLYDLGKDTTELAKFMDVVLESGYYKKWCTEEVDNDRDRFVSSAHYLFEHSACKELKQVINMEQYKILLQDRLFEALDEYRLGYQ